MRFEEVSPRNIGPFRAGATLKVDPKVTVITGANDVGKTCLLRVFHMICTPSPSAAALEDDINRTRLADSGEPWNKDKGIGAQVKARLTGIGAKKVTTSQLPPDTMLESFFSLAPELTPKVHGIRRHTQAVVTKPDKSKPAGVDFQSMPKSILLDTSQLLDSTIEMEHPSALERCFLQAAFGTNFQYSQIDAMSEMTVDTTLQQAEERFADVARKALPSPIKYAFRFRRLAEKPTKLVVQVRDSHRGMVPFALRGAGTKKHLGLLITLISFVREKPCLILLDEPENSLHADAQRVLRRFLESLAEQDGVQVVYATHSPTMINPLRGDSLRLLTQRTGDESIAIAEINNSPIDENLLKVRTALGVIPSDSLLYSDVGIVVEGLTECLALPEILLRLEKEESTRFAGVSHWLPEVHFINGMGDNFERLCKIAKAQGVKPLVFVDGDKIRQLRQIKFEEKYRDIPLVCLPDGIEVEQLVSTSVYFASIAKTHDLQQEGICEEHFNTWKGESTIGNLERRMFTKQVDLWLQDKFDRSLEKPRTMLHAVKSVNVDELQHVETLVALHEAVKRLLECSTN